MTADCPLTVAITEEREQCRYRCVGAFPSVEDALAHLGAARDASRVLLVEICLPGLLGIEHASILVLAPLDPARHGDGNLTPHELRLLRLLATGHNYKTAAVALGVSVNTVSFHIRHIYGKLGVHSKSEAVAKALRTGLIR